MKDRSKVGMGVALLSIAAATTVLQRNPAPGILPSLYYGVPSYVWFLLILPIVLSAIIGLTDTSSRWLAFSTAGLAMSVLYLLPRIRTGLPNGRGDVLTHIGWIRSLSGGTFEPDLLFYPYIHIHVSQLSFLLDVNTAVVVSIYLLIIVTVYVTSFYALVRSIIPRAETRTVVFLFLLLPLFGTYSNQVTPNGVGLFLLAPLTFIIFKTLDSETIRQKARWSVVFLVFMPIMVVSHPLIGYVFIPTFFISMALFKTKIGEIRYENSSPSFLLVSMINLGLLLGITYTAWYVLSTEIWSGFLGRLIQYSQGIERATTASADVSGRASALSTAELVELFLVRYGGEAVVGLLTTLGVGLYHTGKSKLEPGRGGHFIMILLTVWMCASGIWLFVGLVEPQVTVPPLRFLRLIYLPSAIFAGLAVQWVGDYVTAATTWTAIGRYTFLVAVVLFLVSMQTVSFYDGLHTTGVSGQQSHHEIEGTDWLLENKDEDIAALGYGGYRYVDSIIGPENRSERRDEFPRSFDRFGVLPPRLTTEEGRFILDVLDEPRYVRVTDADHVFGIQQRVLPSDEKKVAASTDKIYTNGEYTLYLHDEVNTSVS